MWLDSEFKDYEVLKDILCAYPSEAMEMYRVSNVVNFPKTDSENNILPAEE